MAQTFEDESEVDINPTYDGTDNNPFTLDEQQQEKEFIADPNAKGVVQRSKESLGASKVEAEKLKVEAQRTRKELKDLGALPWIVHPDAPWLKLWDFVQALTITYLFVELPIRFAFINTQLALVGHSVKAYSDLDIAVDVLMLLDFQLKFARAYYDYDYHGQQHLRVKPKEIAQKYLKTSMIRDSLACLPLDTLVILAGHPQTASAVRLLRLLRVERVAKFKQTVNSYVDRSVGRSWLRPIVSGMSLVLGTMFFNHVLACILYTVGSEIYDEPGCEDYEGNRCGWVARMGYKPETGLLPRYADAFYFTFTILTTVGFGDITAHSTMERMMTVIAMTAGCAIFGIVMGQITAVIHGMNMGLAHYEERVRELEQYMQFRNINNAVRVRVKRYIVEKYPEKRLYNERAILNSLPLGLRTEFQMDMYMDHLVALPFLPNYDHEVLLKMCQIIRQDVIMPGQILVREGSKLRHFYTVVSGKITVQVPALDRARAAQMRPASWMLSDEELLERSAQWSKMAEQQEQNQDAVSDDNIIVVEGTKLRPGRLRKQANIDLPPDLNEDNEGFITLAILHDSHYFCEQCLSYDAPSLKRYTAKNISTVGVVDKDACAHLIAEYPSVRCSVREYMLIKFKKICLRLTKHINGERILPPAALLDSRFEANMMCKVIDAWGGAQEVSEAARISRSTSYIGVLERTYSAFEPAKFGVSLNSEPDMQAKKEQRKAEEAQMSDTERILKALQRIEEAQYQLSMQVDADHHRITTIQREVHSLASNA